jgi:hypothetical protein
MMMMDLSFGISQGSPTTKFIYCSDDYDATRHFLKSSAACSTWRARARRQPILNFHSLLCEKKSRDNGQTKRSGLYLLLCLLSSLVTVSHHHHHVTITDILLK